MQMSRTVAYIAISSTLIVFTAAGGQEAATKAPQAKPASESSPAMSSTVLHTGANLVLVDVVVTQHDKPVHGLDRLQFHIFEDEREQPIKAFDEHRPSAAPPNASAVAAQIAALPPHTYTNIPVYPDNGVVNVLLLDALNTPLANQAEARRQMIEYMSSIKPGTSLAIFTLASHLQLVEPFTTDAARLAKAMKSKATSSSQSVVTEPQGESVQSDIENMLGQEDPSEVSPFMVGALTQFEGDLTAFQTNLRVQMTMDALQQLARYLTAIPGRKNLIWFSGSFPITIDPDDTLHNPFRNVQSYGDEIRKTSALLTAARVAVYPVDARGMMTSSTVDANYTPSPNGLSVDSQGNLVAHSKAQNVSNDYTKFLTQTTEEHGSIEAIADETGGKAFVNTNDLKGAVESAIESGSSYYTIAYDPGVEKPDGSFRRLKVSMDKGGYKIAYRKGYFADPASGTSAQNPEGANLITAAILHGAPPSTQIILEARVLPSTDPIFQNVKFPEAPAGMMAATMKGPLRRYVVDLSVNPRDFAFDEAQDGARLAKLEFLLVAYDAQGNRVNFLDQALTVNFKPKQYQDAMTNGLHARMALDLPAGRDSLRIAVQDLSAGRSGSLEVPLKVEAN
jgi:VWFA-related protein